MILSLKRWLRRDISSLEYSRFWTRVRQLADASGKQIKEKDFVNYRGSVQLTLTDTTHLSDLEELMKFLNKHSSCCPCNIVIKVQNASPLTPECFQLLLKLKDRISEIRLEDVEEIDFKTLAVSEADEYSFIQHLEKFKFLDLKKLTLSDHSKKDWTAKDFSRLFIFFHSRDLLKESYRLCTSYQDIVLPGWFTLSEAIDFEGFAVDQIPHLLAHCPT